MTDAGLQTVCLMKGVLRLSVRLSGVGAQAVASSTTQWWPCRQLQAGGGYARAGGEKKKFAFCN